jgi:hypothetical protein
MKKPNIISQKSKIFNSLNYFSFMDKKQINDTFKGVASEVFMHQLEKNDRTCGTSAQLAEGMEFTLTGFDYFDGRRTVGEDAYAKVEPDQKHRYVANGDGTYTVDNSYYGCTAEGAVTAISFRTLTSAAQAPSLFQGCEVIPAGRASQVAMALKPYIGKKFKVNHVESWEANEEWNGRTQRYAGRAVGFEVINGEKKGK